ncbi:hypothetical protein P171DRAFT_241261 [Karstenula rhodostoma CBS 690.94]|uniref:Secreted protein n=1 Tax=Karstenula rhodostoma CBS 690.94 TaxID=1392251 RepID=A0A9P4UEY2_9PLEO|nr:hypothetical protein P171DRAFT_241261 [Karstenula rhodostoma CBS 690.94]
MYKPGLISPNHLLWIHLCTATVGCYVKTSILSRGQKEIFRKHRLQNLMCVQGGSTENLGEVVIVRRPSSPYCIFPSRRCTCHVNDCYAGHVIRLKIAQKRMIAGVHQKPTAKSTACI